MNTDRLQLFFKAWKKLIGIYVASLAVGLIGGFLLVQVWHMRPERIFELSSKRLSYALPVLDMGSRHGIDMGLLLFVWNTIGALITLSFIYAAGLFDPDRAESFPKGLRRIFRGTARMKLLCYLPGCARIEAEPVRRLYVWLMVPLLGMVLLGLESGFQVSTATYLFGSFHSAFVALLPHGVIEIPSLALAGAVPYSAHLMVGRQVRDRQPHAIFRQIAHHRQGLPVMKIATVVTAGLLLAGWIEGHVTPLLSVHG